MPSKQEMDEMIFNCLTGEVYEFQFHNEKPRKNVGTVFSTEKINKQKEAKELEEDIRSLNRINRGIFSQGEEDQEESKKRENKKLKEEIEDQIRSESGYYA